MQDQNRDQPAGQLEEMLADLMQHHNGFASPVVPSVAAVPEEAPIPGLGAISAAERTRLRQGVMHVRLRHFYCTLEEMAEPGLRGLAFVVGTGTGRPNEPGRVIDVSPAAQRLG